MTWDIRAVEKDFKAWKVGRVGRRKNEGETESWLADVLVVIAMRWMLLCSGVHLPYGSNTFTCVALTAGCDCHLCHSTAWTGLDYRQLGRKSPVV